MPTTVVRALRLAYLIWALPWTTGAMSATPGTSRAIAWASSSVRFCWRPEATPPVPRWPGCTISRLVPIALKRSMTCFCAPLPMASIAITAPTPMMIPSIARIERSLLASRLLMPTLNTVQKSMAQAPARRR